MEKKLPIFCPSCDHDMEVLTLGCPNCETKVSGHYPMPTFSKLSSEEQTFIMQFFITSGNIKLIAQQYGISYPTMRNKLDDLIQKIKKLDQHEI